MLLEVPKENVSDLDEWLRRKRRIQFYSRLGVKVLKDVNYLLPIQIDDYFEKMYLMIKLSKNITRISKKSIIAFIDSVYTDVYDYGKDDLLSKTTADLPDFIDIEELRGSRLSNTKIERFSKRFNGSVYSYSSSKLGPLSD
jgi:hypothetical protein